MLRVNDLSAGYGDRNIVENIDLEVAGGEIVSLIGHNGAGKSTLLKAIFGVIPISRGEVLWRGSLVKAMTPKCWRAVGMAFIPQGGRVFLPLSVGENLQIASMVTRHTEGTREEEEEVIEGLFPVLAKKARNLASALSGGERQMLALACGLLGRPRVLLLDEPSLGLSSDLTDELFLLIRDLGKRRGIGLLIVEQKVRRALEISDRAYVLRRGGVVFDGSAGELLDEKRLREVYL
jgi:branched-chain amino acid transport system ATP-binding protein